MINIFTTYSNIPYQQLLYNFCKKKIDKKVINWITSFLTNCQRIVKTNKYTTSILWIILGFSQGSPLLSILYLFYNRDLLKDYAKKVVDAQEYIDDIIFIATSNTVKNNNQKLAKANNQVCNSSRTKHESKFSLLKYQLIYISKKNNINYILKLRLMGGHSIQEKIMMVNLGITFQSKFH